MPCRRKERADHVRRRPADLSLRDHRRGGVTLSETATGGNVFYMAQRYAGMQHQLRFANGGTSYIVFASEGNAHVGANSSSGLAVMRGTDRILDKPCTHYSDFSADFDYSTLPEDSKTYSAM